MDKRLMTAAAVAEMLDVSLPRVYELSRSVFPKGVVVRLGRRIRFDPEALTAWIKNGGSERQRGEPR